MKKGQKGQVAILVLIILLIVGVFIFNLPKTPTNQEEECLIGGRPQEPFSEIQLPVINNFSEGNGHDGTIGQPGGFAGETTKRPYVLVREKVPFDPSDRGMKSMFPNRPSPDGKDGDDEHFVSYGIRHMNDVDFEVYYPNTWGESTLDRDYNFVYDAIKNTDLQFHQEGFLFFLRLKSDGQPEAVSGVDRRTGVQTIFWLADLYQEKTRYEASLTGARGYTYDDVFKCQPGSQNGVTIEYPSVTPGQEGSKNQLQLKNFIVRSSNNYGFSAHCKPAIYLYPEKKTEVSVKVDTKGFLTYTDPLYPVNGWKAIAYPDGKITVGSKDYEYLYYESKIPDKLIDVPKEGFVVAFNDLPELFGKILPRLGLSAKQTFDFITYWEKGLPTSPFYFVGVLSEENINNFEPLTINPKPATIIRVRLYFQALDKKIEIVAPRIIQPEKKGFTVVEWGGMIKTDKNHPFTCSQ